MAKGRKTGGRTKGTPNKLTGDVRTLILDSLAEVGGKAYLVEQANTNPAAFMTLLGKCLPRDVNNNMSGSVNVTSEDDWFAEIDGADTGIKSP